MHGNFDANRSSRQTIQRRKQTKFGQYQGQGYLSSTFHQFHRVHYLNQVLTTQLSTLFLLTKRIATCLFWVSHRIRVNAKFDMMIFFSLEYLRFEISKVMFCMPFVIITKHMEARQDLTSPQSERNGYMLSYQFYRSFCYD